MGPAFENLSGNFMGGVFIIRKEHFMAIKGYDTTIKAMQHTEFALRLAPYLKKNNLRMVTIPDFLIKINVHDGPRIRFNFRSVFEGSARTFELHEEKIKLDKSKHRNYLRVIVFNGLACKRYDQTAKFLKLLVKHYPLETRTWWYALRYFGRYFSNGQPVEMSPAVKQKTVQAKGRPSKVSEL